MDIFPIVEEDFITSSARQYLFQWIKQNENLFNLHESSIEYWNKKCIYYAEEYIPNDIKYILKTSCLAMREFIAINIANQTSEYLYSEEPQLVRWKTGDVMTPHADNIEQDNVTPNTSPWRSFGGVIFLNSDFDGGKLYYPNIGVEVNPKPGMVVLHPAGIKYTHGVSEVTRGIRYTISNFFTFDKEHAGFQSESD